MVKARAGDQCVHNTQRHNRHECVNVAPEYFVVAPSTNPYLLGDSCGLWGLGESELGSRMMNIPFEVILR